MAKSIHTYALARAAVVLGGEEKLSAYLDVSAAALHLWMRGDATPPEATFLKVIDLLVESSIRELGKPAADATGPEGRA